MSNKIRVLILTLALAFGCLIPSIANAAVQEDDREPVVVMAILRDGGSADSGWGWGWEIELVEGDLVLTSPSGNQFTWEDVLKYFSCGLTHGCGDQDTTDEEDVE